MDSFSGLAISFADEMEKGRVYIFTVTNLGIAGSPVTYAPATFYLTGGYLALFGVDGQLTEYAGTNTITVVGSGNVRLQTVSQNGTTGGGTYSELVYFSLFNPMRVVGFKMATNDSSNFENVIQIQPLSPFKRLENRLIYLGTHRNEADFKDNLLTVREGFDFNNQTQISTTISAGASGNLTYITFTLVFGAILNTAVALARKAHRGHKNARKHRK